MDDRFQQFKALKDLTSVVEATLKTFLFSNTQSRFRVLLPQIDAVGAAVSRILRVAGIVVGEHCLIFRRVQISISNLL